MYADRVEATTRGSIKDRLNVNVVGDFGRRRQITGKRPRQDDDKWEHDLYEDRRIDAKDLRLKLQKKNAQKASLSGNRSVSGMRDLREKLSGTTYLTPGSTDPPKRKPVLLESIKPVRESVIVENPEPETKRVASSVPVKKMQQQVESVDNFLQSLGLEKYSISFRVEEVDMATLVHMSDNDLKALGIPMGPRKKILLALDATA
ncbi:hypothetical protein NMG60_11014241 [Bertholletia excelsa]